MAIRTALALSDRRSLAGTRPAFLLGQRFTGWMGGGADGWILGALYVPVPHAEVT